MTILLDGTNGVTTAGITLGSTAIASTGAELNILDGVTSTAAELLLWMRCYRYPELSGKVI